ncbi:phage minor tail protein domain-containing protein [Pantoea sp. USHLN298]|uniref:phage minor tail protein domain-containing protein n=1 Tax=Pantoea sp. USHLN298 TaxID=3081294 RepID=UPI003019E59F
MFLEKTVFQYGAEQRMLSELTALQRAEFFAFITTSAADDETVTDAARGAALVRLNTESNAWLVSRALWNCHREADVNEIYEQILADWPEKALSMAAEKVMALSDLQGDEKSEEVAAAVEDTAVKQTNGS